MRADPVPLSLVERFQAAAAAENVSLARIDDVDRAGVAALVAEGTRLQGNDAGFRGELAYWLRPRSRGARRDAPAPDGMPIEALGVPAALSGACVTAVRGVRWGGFMSSRERHLVMTAPALVVLCSTQDCTRDWIVAGMSLQRVLLLAASRGLSAGFFGQVVMVPGLRDRLRDRLGLPGIPQVLLRLGVTRSQVCTGRRPVDEVLTGVP